MALPLASTVVPLASGSASAALSLAVALGASFEGTLHLPLQVVLQGSDPGPLPEWVVAFVRATDVLSALVGLLVAYLAYRGFRNNESRPMLYVAVGFALALGVPFGLLVLRTAIPAIPRTAIAVVQQLSQLGGLLLIVYGLYVPERRRTPGEDGAG